jgi:hypothetical protein
MHPSPLLIALLPATLFIAGCGTTDTSGGTGSNRNDVQDASASSIAMNLVIDAALDGINDLDTDNESSGDPSATTVAPRAPTSSGSYIIDLAALTRPDGSPRFPDATGRFTVTIAAGAAVVSQPTASTTSLARLVTVDFAAPSGFPVTYTDTSSATTIRIASGVISMDLDTTLTVASPGNWTNTIDAVVAIPTSAPLSIAMTANGATRNVSLSGQRTHRIEMTRARSGSGPSRTSTLAISRTISGTSTHPRNANDNLSDDVVDALGYAGWTVTTPDGALVWNRNATLSETINLVAGTRTASSSSDRIFISYRGLILGPFTAADVVRLFRTGDADITVF